ncbi:MAG: hypothetical protein DMG51_04015 [Acidobacteria bacterium]|nr:MAG: hypothetical protein DMG51_04015 [Acidobacteriota bacterium]
MKHMTEEELIAYREGVAEQGALISKHLAACEECRTELERIEAVLAALDTLPVPDPGVDYGRRMWREIAPRLAEKPGRWWHRWTEPRRLAAAGLIVALIVAAWWLPWANTWATPRACWWNCRTRRPTTRRRKK